MNYNIRVLPIVEASGFTLLSLPDAVRVNPTCCFSREFYVNKVEFKNADLKLAASASRSRNGYILLTGATGLVGQYLLRNLLSQGQRLAVLVRPTKKLSAHDRIETIMQRLESELNRALPRPIVLDGHLHHECLALSDSDQNWVRKHCDRIIHNAAVLKFESTGRNGEPWTTNLDGTRHVVEFAKACKIVEFHYVSTAYVSGICDRFEEADFDQNQEFRNDYERSKFEAEKLVRSTGFASKTIYRPGIIVGDSESGFTASYHGLYVYLRLMAKLIPHQQPDANGIRRTPIHMPVDADQPRNLVPVDWVANVISSVVGRPEKHGQTYHLVPDTRPTHRQILEYCYQYFNSEGVLFGDSIADEDTYNDNNFAQQFLTNVAVYSAYDRCDPEFGKGNVEGLGEGMVCPVIDKNTIFRFLDFGESDKWGKKKIRKPEYDCWLEKNGQGIFELLQNRHAKTIGINVLGAGGGQWTVTISAEQRVDIERGIHPAVTAVVDINSNDYERLQNGRVEGFWNEFLASESQSLAQNFVPSPK